jgi:hypothetical protein
VELCVSVVKKEEKVPVPVGVCRWYREFPAILFYLKAVSARLAWLKLCKLDQYLKYYWYNKIEEIFYLLFFYIEVSL